MTPPDNAPRLIPDDTMIVTFTARDLRRVLREEITEALKAALAPLRERWISVAAAANHANVSGKLIRKWIGMGLPAATFGRDYRLRITDLDKWLEQHRTNERRGK